ncbi:oxidoreductase [Lentinula aff. detonsa]|nr:oxidoreductase [Lentinula aff. detonsa]
MSKRIKIFDVDELPAHASPSSCWISYKGKVFDVTGFLRDHPGGDDILLKYAGQDVEKVMKDKTEHEHSDSAYDILDEYFIGRLGSNENIVRDEDDFDPDATDTIEDLKKHQFLDLEQALLPQLWYSNFSKAYYLRQVHQPRHLKDSARLFGPEYLEVFTKAKWYVVPILWVPIAFYLFLRSALQFTTPLPPFMVDPTLPLSALVNLSANSVLKTLICFFIGNIVWTLLEYIFHRFLFHVDYYLPDKPIFLLIHFLLHGVHHYVPMDRLRLVMPPPLFAMLEWPMTRLAYKIFPLPIANGIISGAFAFYVLYDCMHYALHHTQLPAYMKEMKKYHLAHHYKNFDLGFGVTSKVWDIVFNTYLPV